MGARVVKTVGQVRLASSGSAEQTLQVLQVAKDDGPARLMVKATIWTSWSERHFLKTRSQAEELADLLERAADLADKTLQSKRVEIGRIHLYGWGPASQTLRVVATADVNRSIEIRVRSFAVLAFSAVRCRLTQPDARQVSEWLRVALIYPTQDTRRG